MRLPKYVFEDNLPHLLAMLAGGDRDRAQALPIDFASVTYYIPAAIVAIIAQLRRWQAEQRPFELVNYRENPAFRYFQRMDFFARLGFDLPEDFHRHAEVGQFVPVREIGLTEPDPQIVATDCARCIVDAQTHQDAFHLIQYSAGEVILNCRQHSEAVGYVSAQYSPRQDLLRLGIADAGIGILESFARSHSPHYRAGMTDEDGLALALRPRVSSKTHLPTLYGRPPNVGVGLSMLSALCEETMGEMFLASGCSWWHKSGHRPPVAGTLRNALSFGGTVCSIGFKRREVDSYLRMLAQARVQLGLQPAMPLDTLFT